MTAKIAKKQIKNRDYSRGESVDNAYSVVNSKRNQNCVTQPSETVISELLLAVILL